MRIISEKKSNGHGRAMGVGEQGRMKRERSKKRNMDSVKGNNEKRDLLAMKFRTRTYMENNVAKI